MGVPVLSVQELPPWGESSAALEPLTFTLEAGDIAIAIGQNLGCSSRFLHLLLGLDPRRGGKIEICGHSLRERQAKLLVGYVGTEPALYEEMTLWQFLALFVEIYEVDLHYRPYAIYEALELTKLTPWKDKPLSQAEDPTLRKRISIARALVHSPRLLVIEDLFQGSDFRTWPLMVEILNGARNTGKAILLSAASLLHLQDLYSQLFVLSGKGVLLYGQAPEITYDVDNYHLVQIQVLEETVDVLLPLLAQTEAVFDLLQKEDDWGVLRFFFKGSPSQLESLVAQWQQAGAAIISCLRLDNFWGRSPTT